MRPFLFLAVLLALSGAAACSSDADEPAAEADPQASKLRDAPVVTHELGAGLLVTLNQRWEPSGVFGEPRIQSDQCTTKQLSITGDPRMTVYLVGASCSVSAIGRNNGEGPFFGSADQLVGGTALAEELLVVGTLTVAQVAYAECTNECLFYSPIVGVIELDNPADPSFPTLVIANDYEGPTRADVRELALAFSAAG